MRNSANVRLMINVLQATFKNFFSVSEDLSCYLMTAHLYWINVASDRMQFLSFVNKLRNFGFREMQGISCPS
jgi:hypothetical protein